MTKIWAMRGFSGSGKSTKAREIAKANNAVVVNRDLLRLQLLGEYWTGKRADEDRVTVAEEAQVNALLRAGTSVVVDNTHLNPAFLRKWAKLATQLGTDFEVVNVCTSTEVCIRNDVHRSIMGERYVGEKVIREQVRRYPMGKWPTITAEPFVIEPVEFTPDLPDAVIVDIDGTLANNVSRSPFDYTKVLEDEVHEEIAALSNLLYDSRYFSDSSPRVIIMSGRDDTCRMGTELWLDMHDIDRDQLIMRPVDAKDERGNKLPDYQVKYDLFNKYIRGVYNVRAVFDDRQQVVDMWRKLGLKCLQVAEGNF